MIKCYDYFRALKIIQTIFGLFFLLFFLFSFFFCLFLLRSKTTISRVSLSKYSSKISAKVKSSVVDKGNKRAKPSFRKRLLYEIFYFYEMAFKKKKKGTRGRGKKSYTNGLSHCVQFSSIFQLKPGKIRNFYQDFLDRKRYVP